MLNIRQISNKLHRDLLHSDAAKLYTEKEGFWLAEGREVISDQ